MKGRCQMTDSDSILGADHVQAAITKDRLEEAKRRVQAAMEKAALADVHSRQAAQHEVDHSSIRSVLPAEDRAREVMITERDNLQVCLKQIARELESALRWMEA